MVDWACKNFLIDYHLCQKLTVDIQTLSFQQAPSSEKKKKKKKKAKKEEDSD